MKILLLRNMSNQININSYNVQEIGLAKALANKGHECDVVLFSETDAYKKEIIKTGGEGGFITVHWIHGFSIYNNAVYFKLIKEKFFDKYDVIQTHEYNQLMTFILPFVTRVPKIIYHGPYQDIRNKTVQKLFDLIFLPYIRRHYKNVIVKSNLSKDYLLQKGFKDVNTIGVGLDQNRFKNCLPLNDRLAGIYKESSGEYPILVYIGTFRKWKNTPFLLDIAQALKKRTKFKLLVIGDGEGENREEFFNKMHDLSLEDCVQYAESVNQREISNIYIYSDLLLLPSTYEIFGMVLLESLYFNCPILTSYNGGSSVLLKEAYPEMVIEGFEAEKWAERIAVLLQNKGKYKLREYVNSKHTWDCISREFETRYSEAVKKPEET